MRITSLLVAAATLALAAGLAHAEPESAGAPQTVQDQPTDVSEAVVEAPQPEADPEICRREMPTGSRIAVKVCKKKSEWVARSRRGGARLGEPTHVDGIDDKSAPLPPSN